MVEELIPNAQVVADRFHVMKQINEELDARRKKEKRQIEKLKDKKEREQKLQGITNKLTHPSRISFPHPRFNFFIRPIAFLFWITLTIYPLIESITSARNIETVLGV